MPPCFYVVEIDAKAKRSHTILCSSTNEWLAIQHIGNYRRKYKGQVILRHGATGKRESVMDLQLRYGKDLFQ